MDHIRVAFLWTFPMRIIWALLCGLDTLENQNKVLKISEEELN